ncbi:MAG: complex I NDUFA9 subunit family protein [Nitrospirota bacterium]
MILVTGATGFVGGHLIKRLIAEGYKIRCLVRDPSKASMIISAGAEPVTGDISEPESLKEAVSGVEKVIHLVGIIQEGKGFTFKSVHVDGTKNLIEVSKNGGVRFFYYQSALGASKDGKTEYFRTKWEAEEIVQGSGLSYTIFRPSIIYGASDKFTLKLMDILRKTPVMPIFGSGDSLLQPIYIDDLITCIIKVLEDQQYHNRIFEIGGPEHITYEDIVNAIQQAIGKERMKLHIPVNILKPGIKFLEEILSTPPITTDQLTMLMMDNICERDSVRKNFGFEPLPFREGLKRFL